MAGEKLGLSFVSRTKCSDVIPTTAIVPYLDPPATNTNQVLAALPPPSLPPKKRNLQAVPVHHDVGASSSGRPKRHRTHTSPTHALRANPQPALLPHPNMRNLQLVHQDPGASSSRRLKRIEAAAMAAAEDVGAEFVCLKCSKKYTSRRSLGGHKAHHTREENKAKQRQNPDRSTVLYEARQQLMQNQHREMVVSNQFQEGPAPKCQSCGSTFLKKQGLAAHSRFCRSKGENVVGSGGGQGQGRRVVHDFDLNKLPVEAY